MQQYIQYLKGRCPDSQTGFFGGEGGLLCYMRIHASDLILRSYIPVPARVRPGNGDFQSQPRNKPPIPLERCVVWCFQNTQDECLSPRWAHTLTSHSFECFSLHIVAFLTPPHTCSSFIFSTLRQIPHVRTFCYVNESVDVAAMRNLCYLPRNRNRNRVIFRH